MHWYPYKNKETNKKIIGFVAITCIITGLFLLSYSVYSGIQTKTVTNRETIVKVVKDIPVNIRETASINGKVAGKAKKGDTFRAVDSTGDWYRIIYIRENAVDTGNINKKCCQITNGINYEDHMEYRYTVIFALLVLFGMMLYLYGIIIKQKFKEIIRQPISGERTTALSQSRYAERESDRPTSVRMTPPPPDTVSELQKVEVQHVIDGDTVVVSKDSVEIRIRLSAIDCPEDGQPWGNIAKAGLIKLIWGGCHVYIEKHGLDDYGRTLATIFIRDDSDTEWINVNEHMVMRGHAWVMRQFYNHLPKKRRDQLDKLEKWAKSKRVGLWKTKNPVPPWQWRNQT